MLTLVERLVLVNPYEDLGTYRAADLTGCDRKTVKVWVERQREGKLGPMLVGADGKLYESAEPGALGGHRRSRVYGRLDCPATARALARGGYVTNRVFFVDEATAVAAGYRPCAVCMPEQYAAWRGKNPAAAKSGHRR